MSIATLEEKFVEHDELAEVIGQGSTHDAAMSAAADDDDDEEEEDYDEEEEEEDEETEEPAEVGSRRLRVAGAGFSRR